MRIKTLALFLGLVLFSFSAYTQNFNKDMIPRVNTVQLGAGSSFMYADIAGGLRNFNFKIRPSAYFSFVSQINALMDVKVSGGFQMIESQYPGMFRDSVL